jgi:hypothetical protein
MLQNASHKGKKKSTMDLSPSPIGNSFVVLKYHDKKDKA